MPARACASGEARVRSLPSNTIRPPLSGISPARQLKKVDLPAPFGPINPMISPSFTVRSAPATAWNSPKLFDTLIASRRRFAAVMRPASDMEASDMEAFPEDIAQSRRGCREPEVRTNSRHFQRELRVQKRTVIIGAGVLIDSEVRTSVPQMLTNFGIGTPAAATVRTGRPARSARSTQ